MQKFTFHREMTGLFTEQQDRLAYRQEELMDFIHLPYSLESFGTQIKVKQSSYSSQQRELLVKHFENQYKHVNLSAQTERNLQLLRDNSTFTVTTGHQLSIFTGPLFFIYKILHTIRLSEELNKQYDDYHFVPVYWMASEDHDFEEIRNVELFGKELSWSTDQKGPVGRFEMDGFDTLRSEFSMFFNGEAFDEVREILSTYKGKDLADATFNLVNRLFSQYGLLILNADDKELKRSFIPILKKEVETEFSLKAVEKTNILLEKEGLKIQVHAREINLFYMDYGIRERILHVEDGFFVEGVGKFSLDQLLELIETSPEKFSPNVVLRPLYQECLLPNLCYIGGVGEIAYWMQLKGEFDAVKVPFPLLAVRNSLIWIDSVTSKKIEKTGLFLEDLFKDTQQLKKEHIQKNEEQTIDLTDIGDAFQVLKGKIMHKVIQADPGLEKMAIAEMVKMEKQLESIGDKLFRSVKGKHDQALVAIDQIKNKLFPANGLQERSTNLFSLCSNGKVDEKIAHLHDFIDPFDNDLIVIRE